MLYKKILEKATYVTENSIEEYLKDNHVTVEFSNTLNEEACLLIMNNKVSIILREDLSTERAKFAILHEIGHYVLDVDNGVYSFTLEFNKSRSEFKANLFACFCLLKNVEMMDLDVIQFLINKGCPQGIAVKVLDYIEKNMKDVLVAH